MVQTPSLLTHKPAGLPQAARMIANNTNWQTHKWEQPQNFRKGRIDTSTPDLHAQHAASTKPTAGINTTGVRGLPGAVRTHAENEANTSKHKQP